MNGVQLVGFSKACAALTGDRDMNYSLNTPRPSRLHGGVGLLFSHVGYNTAYAGDVCRLLERKLP